MHSRTWTTDVVTTTEALILTIRWGGGADPGRYHVFAAGAGWIVPNSTQCVVDDFGNLVPVGA